MPQQNLSSLYREQVTNRSGGIRLAYSTEIQSRMQGCACGSEALWNKIGVQHQNSKPHAGLRLWFWSSLE
jgi:hypothetical protein